MLNKVTFLDQIGRSSRSNKNEKLENFITDLQRLTIVHETDHGGSYYRFASGAATPHQNGGNNETSGTDQRAAQTKQGESGTDKKATRAGEQKQGLQQGPAAEASGKGSSGKANSTDDEASSSENRKVEGE